MHLLVPTDLRASVSDTGGPHKLPAASILVDRRASGQLAGRRQPAVRLRRALIESGVPYMCVGAGCGSTGTWLGKELRLQVEHKSGNWLDDRKENLEFLCPNCHTQTVSWCKNKGGTDITSEAKQHRNRRALHKRLPRQVKTKISWPTNADLQQRVWDQPAMVVAAQLGVSSVAVKKHCTKNGIETPPRGYWMKLKAKKS